MLRIYKNVPKELLSKMHNNVPLCVNCKNFIRENNMTISVQSSIENGKCSMFGTKNIVSGVIEYERAELCRRYDDMCGISGKYFEKK